MLRIVVFLFIWDLICSVRLSGQEYSYVNYNTREGLAGSVVYSIAQDHDGFLWFGTETGLTRFDGSRFKNFTIADGLPDNEVTRLFVDSRNRVWILPFKNALCYYWRGKIYNQQNDSLLKKIKLTQEIQAIAESDAGDLVLLEMQEVVVIKPDGTIFHFDKMNGMPMMARFWAGKLANGNVGFIASFTGKGVYLFEYTGDSIKEIKFVGPPGNLYFPIYYSDRLQILERVGDIKLFFPHTGEYIDLGTPSQFTSCSVLNDSLVSFNGSGSEIYNLRKKKVEYKLLAGKNVSSVFIDRENNLWFAMQGDGVNKLPSLEFKNYFKDEAQNSSTVFSLIKIGDTIFAGSAGLNIWAINTRTGAMKKRSLGKSKNLGRIITLNKLRDGSLLAGTDHSLMKCKGDDIEISNDVYSAVKSVHMSGDSLLVGQSIAAIVIDAKSFRTLDTVWGGRTTAVYKKNDKYFIGTLDGLFIISSKQKHVRAGQIKPDLANKISAICEDRSGNIWIATSGGGIVGYKDGRLFTRITADSGLTSNICRSVYAHGNDLWVGTDQGLNKVKLSNNGVDITRFTVSDGLVSDIINAIWIDSSVVYIATPKGVSFFDENKVNSHSMCALEITAVQSNVHRFPFDTSGVVFPYQERDIRIEFVGISFKSGGQIDYRYRLKGLHDEWRHTNDNFLNYATLGSGSYELELQATNKFAVSSDIARLSFIIQKPFWEKNWFRLLMGLLIGAAIWKFVQYRIRSERKKQEQKAATNRKMAELEQMALKAQMNPHFIFNSLHSIQQYVLDRDIKGANKFITDFARLIRLTLNISMQPRISLHDEINYLSTYLELEKTRLETKFDYVVDVAEGIDVDNSYIPAMILQPHVENSIRHGVNNRQDKEGLIKVMFKIEKGYLVCTVEDNGIGRSFSNAMKRNPEPVYQSKGLLLIQNRIELLNKDYTMPILSEVEDLQVVGNIEGTRVTISFPLGEVEKNSFSE